MRFQFRQASPQEWDAFAAASPQGTVFSTAGFLDCYDRAVDYCLVEDSGKLVAGIAVVKESGEVVSTPMSLGMYQQSVHYAPEIWTGPAHESVGACLKATEFLFQELWSRYGKISVFMHPSVVDIRAVNWFHYGKPELGQFQTSVSYTGLLDLKEYSGFDEYLRSIRRTRRQEFNAASRKNLSLKEGIDLELLVDLHRLTYDRQGLEVKDWYEELLKNIIRFAEKSGSGRMLTCLDGAGGKVAATLFLHDRRAAYYLIGANHPDSRALNAGPLLLLENLKHYWERGITNVDFVGINSPNRGDFKLSFNARPAPYYVGNCVPPAK